MTKRFIKTGIVLIFILLAGTAGYWLLTGRQHSLFDCFYFTVITVSTIGFSEIIDLTGNTEARLFTVILAFSGIAIITYFVSSVSAVFIEGHLKETFKKRKMEKSIQRLHDHYIICGIGRHSLHLLEELSQTQRECVFIDISSDVISKMSAKYPGEKFIEGDATSDDVLMHAEIKKAKGLFATTTDDNLNLVISLSARRLNQNLTIVALCNNHSNLIKIKMSGADKVVSTNFIGGMRMASEMFRPTVTEVLDTMLRGKNENLRIEQVEMTENHAGKKLSDLRLGEFKNTLLLALRTEDEIFFKPDEEHRIKNGDALIIMTIPDERIKLEKLK